MILVDAASHPRHHLCVSLCFSLVDAKTRSGGLVSWRFCFYVNLRAVTRIKGDRWCPYLRVRREIWGTCGN
jgi:hypothetical protein